MFEDIENEVDFICNSFEKIKEIISISKLRKYYGDEQNDVIYNYKNINNINTYNIVVHDFYFEKYDEIYTKKYIRNSITVSRNYMDVHINNILRFDEHDSCIIVAYYNYDPALQENIDELYIEYIYIPIKYYRMSIEELNKIFNSEVENIVNKIYEYYHKKYLDHKKYLEKDKSKSKKDVRTKAINKLIENHLEEFNNLVNIIEK